MDRDFESFCKSGTHIQLYMYDAVRVNAYYFRWKSKDEK